MSRVQVVRKRFDRKCALCPQSHYEALQCHRLLPGSRYTYGGTVTLCASCHALVTAGRIEILGAHLSSTGHRVLHVRDEDGLEGWMRG